MRGSEQGRLNMLNKEQAEHFSLLLLLLQYINTFKNLIHKHMDMIDREIQTGLIPLKDKKKQQKKMQVMK
jgi:hypothetical protein